MAISPNTINKLRAEIDTYCDEKTLANSNPIPAIIIYLNVFGDRVDCGIGKQEIEVQI